MKYLTDREDIARAINFGKYPVLYINMDNRPMSDISDSDYAVGCPTRVAWDRDESRYEGMTTRGRLFFNDGKLGIDNDCCCLSSDFGRSDVLEMVKWAQAPVVHKGQEVVVVQDYPANKVCTVRIMEVSKHIDIHCQTVATLNDREERK